MVEEESGAGGHFRLSKEDGEREKIKLDMKIWSSVVGIECECVQPMSYFEKSFSPPYLFNFSVCRS